ncbi:tektin-4 [Thrips palmi]|uniref:Tektin n=1 Tax=Thrips palmi TaxID=161013 RepID=A0A6P8YWI1_THRPL|nr:tektin-4 [Thrips palmi]
MYTDMDYEQEPEVVADLELEDAVVDLERDDSDLHKVEGRMAPFLPQPEDDAHPCQVVQEGMEPVGPWAQGKADWGPLAGMTGTRPVVDRYSITRYSVPEWRKNNLDTFQRAAGDNHNAGMVDFNSKACMQHVAAEADKNQADCTARLEQRAMDLHRWLAEVRKAHKALWDEIQDLEKYRARLRRLLCVLTKCANVAGECLDLRSKRCDPDLVRDEPEEQLVKEVALIKEVRGLIKRCLLRVEEQQRSSKAAKARLSTNWSDKKEAYDIDSLGAGLRTADPTALFYEGATRFPDSQSTTESWEAASREDICLSENERAKSVMLRNLIDSTVQDAARDLRQQEARVDEAVQRRVQVMTALLQELENQLALILRRIMETERLIADLKRALRQLDMALKVAQTRLSTRMDRTRIENCRDCPQYGLVDEVKSISEQCSALLGQLKQAEDTLQSLVDTRNHLEKDIVQKRKNLYLDRDRIQVIRQHYPPAAALTGLH